jgi:hypothetical protein
MENQTLTCRGRWDTSGDRILLERAFSCEAHFRKINKNYQIQYFQEFWTKSEGFSHKNLLRSNFLTFNCAFLSFYHIQLLPKFSHISGQNIKIDQFFSKMPYYYSKFNFEIKRTLVFKLYTKKEPY